MVHVRMVTVPADLADLPSTLTVHEALGSVFPGVCGLLRAQLRRVARALTVTTDSGRRPNRNGAHMPGINSAEG
eukprot:15469794-Alexandrium_andersonii.AAC.1